MIRSTIIVEIAGTPAEHVKKSLSDYILNLNRMKEVEVHSIKISDPSQLEDSPGMFTCFAEADFSVHDLTRLSEIVFDFMPSSVEVTEPSSVSTDPRALTELFNSISGRMHRYDDIAKASYAQIKQLRAALDKTKKKSSTKKAASKKAVKKVKKTKKAKKSSKKKK